MTTESQYALFNAVCSASESDHKISLLALSRIPGVGSASIRALFKAYKGELATVWSAEEKELDSILRKARIPQHLTIIERIRNNSQSALFEASEQLDYLKNSQQISLILQGESAYPERLCDLTYSPLWLFVQGNIDILHKNSTVAVVGTRKPTNKGIDTAKELSVRVARNECIVVSGLAEGIDAVSHRVAVDLGIPTIAVLGHGINVVFPSSTAGLRDEIVSSGGAVVSEYLPNESYSADKFVMRNRIIAALSNAVAVIEGRAKSGTAHTVKFASELKRKIFGARLGPSENIPEQELLEYLERWSYPVFDLLSEVHLKDLRAYLKDAIPFLDSKKVLLEPRIFYNLIAEVQRVATYYNATEQDFAWLIDQIENFRKQTDKENPSDADQSGNSRRQQNSY